MHHNYIFHLLMVSSLVKLISLLCKRCLSAGGDIWADAAAAVAVAVAHKAAAADIAKLPSTAILNEMFMSCSRIRVKNRTNTSNGFCTVVAQPRCIAAGCSPGKKKIREDTVYM